MSKPVRPIFLAGMLLCALGGFGWMLFVARKIVDGHGLDSYFTWWGVQFNYIGALVLIACVFLVGLAAALLTWLYARQKRDFKREYKIEDTDTLPPA